MVFASPVFLFLFLPLALALYRLVPPRARNATLLLASVAFYAWGEAYYLPLVGASVLFNWAMGLAIAAAGDPASRRRRLAVAIAGNLLALGWFKYANFAVANVNALAPILSVSPIALSTIPLPLGISFFTFHAISYVVDVHKRNAEPQRRILDFALYILAFPQLIAGPIIRWRDIASQIAAREQRLADFAYGVRRFVLGLAKKVLVANTLGQAADRVFALPAAELTTPLAWLGIVGYTLQIYFDFSGYSDMAIGLMRMFGFRILENFNYPYVARSIREFWRRWHISLSNWFRDYLYIPLGGNHRGPGIAYRNLAIVFLLCGLWHGASWPFVLWGAWHGGFLIAERAGLSRLLERNGVIAHAYTILAVMGGWVLFRADTLAHAIDYYKALLGFGAPSAASTSMSDLVTPWLVATLVVAIVAATPVLRDAGRRFESRMQAAHAPVAVAADAAWLGLMMLLSCAFLAASGYNPFIYFRF